MINRVLVPDAAITPAVATTAIEHAGPTRRALPQLGYVHCFALVMTGQLTQAQHIAEHGHHTAEAEKNAAVTTGWTLLRGLIAHTRGDLTTAVDYLDTAAHVLDRHDPYRMLAPCLSWLASAQAMSGDRTEARHTLRRVAEVPADRLVAPWLGLSQAWTTAADGDTTLAARQADTAADHAQATGQYAVEARARYDVARLGDPHTTHRRLATLTGMVQGPLTPAMASAAAALARNDAHGLDRATTTFTQLGFDLLAAETRTAAAALRNQPTAAPTAATPLLRLTPALTELTRRERDVALLAADGMTSSAIGTRLRLSARTIDNCLGRIYQKLGVTNRRDVVPLIVREQLPAHLP